MGIPNLTYKCDGMEQIYFFFDGSVGIPVKHYLNFSEWLKWQHRFFVLRIFGQGFIRTTMRSTTVIAGMAALVFQF